MGDEKQALYEEAEDCGLASSMSISTLRCLRLQALGRSLRLAAMLPSKSPLPHKRS